MLNLGEPRLFYRISIELNHFLFGRIANRVRLSDGHLARISHGGVKSQRPSLPCTPVHCDILSRFLKNRLFLSASLLWIQIILVASILVAGVEDLMCW